MTNATKIKISVVIGSCLVGVLLVYGWTPLPVKQDRLFFMSGSQPGSVALELANRCDNCHGGYNKAVEPAHNWRGGMMAHAARDPLWAACLTVALQDSIHALGHTNAEIAGKLHFSENTVETHRAHILTKLGLRTRADLVRFSIE